MQTTITTAQQKLLNIIPPNMDETDLKNIQDILVKYFAVRAMDGMDEFWNEKGFKSDEDMYRYLNEK
jgi:hypothetical protein